MNVNLQPNVTGTNINLVKGAIQADLTNDKTVEELLVILEELENDN